MSPLVTAERDGDVAVVTLRREGKLNALSMAVERELLGVLDGEAVKTSRAIVVTGAGRAFSAGADLSEIRDLDVDAIAAYYRDSGRVYETVAGLPQVTVSAIHGYCLGGGLELALASDLRIADETAVFGLPEVGLGILPSSGGLTRLVRMLGTARARELILVGDQIDATDAYRMGLVTAVTPAGAATVRALELAHRLARKPALGLTVAKQAIDAVAESSTAAALLIERLGYGMLNQSKDARG